MCSKSSPSFVICRIQQKIVHVFIERIMCGSFDLNKTSLSLFRKLEIYFNLLNKIPIKVNGRVFLRLTQKNK